MKKIGIITVSRTTNFGAELQAFALQHKLNNLGYFAEVIDYLYFKNKRHIATKKSTPELPFSKKDVIKNKLLYGIIGPLIDTILPLFHKATRQKRDNFLDFHKKNTKFSKEYKSIDVLYSYNHGYDVFITGSDQVWNPATFSSLKPYLLDFVPLGTKRISYAASFGVSEVSMAYKNTYAAMFNQLNDIGVREEKGKELVKEISGRDAEVVLDPTLLLTKDDWKVVTADVDMEIRSPYILIYDLHPSEALLSLTFKMSKEMNLPVYRLCKRAYRNPSNDNIINIEDAGPAEFIYMFMNASYVITNSFHGTVFSTNFNIPFNAVLNPNRKNNSRITGFLDMTSLSDRIIWEDKKINENNKKVSFESANKTLKILRDKSILFLKNSISN